MQPKHPPVSETRSQLAFEGHPDFAPPQSSANPGTSSRVPVGVLQLHRDLACLPPGDELNRMAIVAEHRRDPYAPED